MITVILKRSHLGTVGAASIILCTDMIQFLFDELPCFPVPKP